MTTTAPLNVRPSEWKRWRPYQVDCFDALSKYYTTKKGNGTVKALVEEATGLGKRAQAVFMACKMPNCLFLADSEELIEQAYWDFVDLYGVFNVGIVRGNKFEIDKKIVVSSPQTMVNRLHLIPKDHFAMVQIDEAHKYMAKTFVRVVEYFTCRLRIGWTATPYRLDGLSLGYLFDDTVFSYNLLDGIRNGYLAELRGIRVKTNLDLTGVSRSMGDFNTSQLTAIVDTRARNSLVVESYKKYAEGRQAVCFACDIQHCQHLKEIFDERGVSCEILVSDSDITDDRKGVVARFKAGEFMVLINVNMFTTGADHNDVGAILWARPTMSQTLYVQGTGRATRLKSKAYVKRFGQQALVIDFVDNTTKLQLVNSYELDKGKHPNDRVFITREDRDKLNEERERRKRTFEAVTNKDTECELMVLPKVCYDQAKAWMHDTPTDAQINFAKTLGIYEDDVIYTKGLLSEAIANAPAERWQFKKAREWGYDVSSGLTRGQYELIKKKHDEPATMRKKK